MVEFSKRIRLKAYRGVDWESLRREDGPIYGDFPGGEQQGDKD